MQYICLYCRTNEPKAVNKEEGESKEGLSKKQMKRMIRKQQKLEQKQKQPTQSKTTYFRKNSVGLIEMRCIYI